MYKISELRIVTLLVTLFLFGVIEFLLGFFPVIEQKLDNSSDKYDKFKSMPWYVDSSRPPPPVYTRVSIMLIDALRFDYGDKSRMPFTNSNACGYLKLRSSIPTVTMPRIKSIISGTISTFADIILNLGHANTLNNTILHHLKDRGDKLIFAGDRTWIELFPDIFERQTVNSDSFYVNDFYEGDKNVTKVVLKEIQETDWNLMILHYLGLDHIGHVEGTSSQKINTKLLEMDDVVKILTEQIGYGELILVTADHGMRNGGGHGGSTPEEIYVPLFFISKNCTKQAANMEYKQIDFAPTIAILLSTEIPRTSIGCLIPELLSNLTPEHQLNAYYYNTEHLINKTRKLDEKLFSERNFREWFSEAKSSHKHYLESKHNNNVHSNYYFEKSKREYMRLSNELSNELSKHLIDFRYDLIIAGLWLTTSIFIFIFCRILRGSYYYILFLNGKKNYQWLLIVVGLLTIALWFRYISKTIINCGFTFTIILSVYLTLCILRISKEYWPFPTERKHLQSLPLLPLSCFAFHILALHSSSFIEEEHLIWYYFCSTIVVVMVMKIIYKNRTYKCNIFGNLFEFIKGEVRLIQSSVFLLIIMTLVKKLNQSGDKWRHLTDVGDILNMENNKLWLCLFTIYGLLFLFVELRNINTRLQNMVCVVNIALIFLRNMSHFTNFVNTKFISDGILILFLLNNIFILGLGYISNRQRRNPNQILKATLTCSALISALLHAPHNIVLTGAMLYTLRTIYELCHMYCKIWCTSKLYNQILTTIMSIIIAKMYFYCQGNTNSLATIDVRPGFIGQISYNPIIAGILITFNTFNSQINALLCLTIHISIMHHVQIDENDNAADGVRYNQGHNEQIGYILFLYSIFIITPMAVYLYSLIIFRYHLFIYTVFAPKALYESYNVFLCILQLIYFNILLHK